MKDFFKNSLTVVFQAELGIVRQIHSEWQCVNFDVDREGLICPFGFVNRDIITCPSCPPTNISGERYCVCEPCVAACPELSVLSLDGTCNCEENTIPWQGKCAKTSTVLISTLLPACLAIIALFFLYGRYQHHRAENIWKIDSDELTFDDPPHVLGAGSFGVVLRANYKGVEGVLFSMSCVRLLPHSCVCVHVVLVAVKRAIASSRKKSKSRIFSQKLKSVNGSGGSSGSWKQKKRRFHRDIRATFEEAEVMTRSGGSTGGSKTFTSSNTKSSAFIYKATCGLFGSSPADQARSALHKEARILSRTRHPNICSLVGAVCNFACVLCLSVWYFNDGV